VPLSGGPRLPPLAGRLRVPATSRIVFRVASR
jgi:hypothetical protein